MKQFATEPLPDSIPVSAEKFLKLVILTQEQILEKLPDEETRERWVDDHAETFRKLADTNEEFRRLIEKKDLAGIEAWLTREN